MKYELLEDDTIDLNGITLKRVKYLRDGSLGGYIESEKNLSQAGGCVVEDEAKVFGNAKVMDEALVGGKSEVGGHSMVIGKAIVMGDAQIIDRAIVKDQAIVQDRGVVMDNATVGGYARVKGQATVKGFAVLKSETVVGDRSLIAGETTLENVVVENKVHVRGNCTLKNHVLSKPGDIINIIFQGHEITMTKTHIYIGCQQKTWDEWYAVTEEQAKNMTMQKEVYWLIRKMLIAVGEFHGHKYEL